MRPGRATPRARGLSLSLAATLALCLLGTSPDAPAAEDPAPAVPPVDAKVLTSKIEEVEASTTLGEDLAASLIELYRRALTSLERARAEQQSADAFAAAASGAPAELARIREALDAMPEADVAPVVPEDTPLEELEASLATESAALADAEARLARLRESGAAAVARPAIARERLTEAGEERDAVLAELNAPPPLGESAELTQARRWHLQARAYRLNAETRSLEQELLTRSARLELLEAQQQLATRTVEQARARTRSLEDAMARLRGQEAETAREQAEAVRRELADRHPSILELARGNVELSDELAGLVVRVQKATDARDAAREQASRIDDGLASTQSKLAVAGLSQALGQLLIEQRRTLPSLSTLRRQAREGEREVATVGLRQLQLADQRRDLRDMSRYVEGRIAGLPAEEAGMLRPELLSLATTRRDLVQKSIEAGARYLNVLGELNLAQRQLIGAVRDYDAFLDSRLLWVRNTAPVDVKAFASTFDDVMRMLTPTGWQQLLGDFAASLRTKPLMAAILIALLVLATQRRRFLAGIASSAPYVRRITTDRLWYSLQALGYTALAAAPLPLAIAVAGWLTSSVADPVSFSHAMASGIMLLGFDLLVLQFFIDVCRDEGVALRHCRWSPPTVARLLSELRWFIVAFPAVRLLGEVSVRLDAGTFLGGLTVLGTVGAAVAVGLFIFRLFTPAGGVLRDYLAHHPDLLLAHWRPVWFIALNAVVPALLLLWLAGYLYTADVLAMSFMHSIWLVLSLVMVQSLLTRALLRGYQRLRIKAAKERRDAARAAREATVTAAGKPVVADDKDLEVEEAEVDVASLDNESRKLLRIAMMFVTLFTLSLIWAPLLPALGLLEDVGLWTRTALVEGDSIQVPVTLADLLIAIVVGLAAGAAARSLPSFVELLLLQRNVSAGARYTATTLLRYVIVGGGVIFVFGLLGGSWSQIQWLVAALGVGIGFGLQEIVANFISGLIILFERPIRVGDIVTVGDTSGVVTRIQIRATTIRDWDRRELLVPNREFITGRLLNWTLSDTVVRLVVKVGVQYGSDVVKAMKLMEEAARENQQVLDEPAPFVTFSDFGDSALNLTLRAYLPSMEHYLVTASDLHAGINAKLNQAGIVIAFPQRDLHLDTSAPLEIRLESAADTLSRRGPAKAS